MSKIYPLDVLERIKEFCKNKDIKIVSSTNNSIAVSLESPDIQLHREPPLPLPTISMRRLKERPKKGPSDAFYILPFPYEE